MMFLSVWVQGVWQVWNLSTVWTSLFRLTTLMLIFPDALLLQMQAIRWCQKVSADSKLEGKAELDTSVESVSGGDGVVECGKKRRSSCQVVNQTGILDYQWDVHRLEWE
ncbi:hypothetical protein DFH08DRAFT_802555 [Mycena albidolilacea]|uniref:Uncharacterized protein n=1 Tax=Mycena albidolilacea TaxID=1033008 RepID=A0AAD7AEB5_9AGAR|nr:hypothetical protein DFH08DRAFT_802555 [Mycena albidolilacea]